MNREEIIKMFRRIELDKTNDSCGFEFADGFGCTFDNIAICYDDRLKLYELTKQLEKENQELKEEIRELEFIIGLRTKRNLIRKFDKEYDEEDKKKNPNRDYEAITPDAEEVYKRYYNQKEKINTAIEDITFCINNMKNEYACTDERTNRELHTMVGILEETLKALKEVK